MRLQLAMLFAKDVDRMTAFYRDGLGLAVVPEKSSEGWVVFDAGGALFALHAIPPAIARSIEITDPPQERSDTAIKLVFQADDVEAVCVRLATLGGKPLPPRASGSRDVLDPEGNVLNLTGV
jgi:catechol 2,3-dioxygenase-like lactoylglutathione lyase family enzyme